MVAWGGKAGTLSLLTVIDSSGAPVGCARSDAQTQASWLELGGLCSCSAQLRPRPPAQGAETLFCLFNHRQKSSRNCASTRTGHFSGGGTFFFFCVRRSGSVPNTGSRRLFNGSHRSGSTVGIKLHLSPLQSALFFPDWLLWFPWRGKWSSQCSMPFCLF